MWGAGKRRFSTLRKRMSMTGNIDEQQSPNHSQIKAKLKQSRTRTRRGTNRDRRDTNSTEDMPFSRNRVQSTASLKTRQSHQLELEPMPDPEEVDEMLEVTLDEMAIPEGNKQKFRDQTIEKKWEVIQLHSKYHPSKKGKDDVRSASYWIRKLKDRDSKGRPRMTPKEALNMESVFRTSHRDFITSFLESYGVKEMNKLADYFTNRTGTSKKEGSVLSSLVEAYRLLMNTELGMRGVLLVPGTINSIAMCIDFTGENTVITEKVVLLLSVTCWWDEDGRKKVMDAMRYIKSRHREMSCFLTLVYLFEHNDNLEFKANMATFFTTICNTPPSIEERVGVRNYFFRLDIINIFDKVLAKAPEDAMSEEGPWLSIQTQYQVFVTMMRQDQKEIVHKLIAAADADASHFDLSNLHDSWKILQRNALKADVQDQLMNVVQALFLVPTVHSLAVPIYDSIAKYIFEATSVDKLELASGEKTNTSLAPPINFEALGKLLKKKIEYNAKVEAFEAKDGLTKRLRKLVGILQKRLMDVAGGVIPPENALDLQEDLIKNHLLKAPQKGKKVEMKTAMSMPASTSAVPGDLGVSGISTNIAFLTGLGFVDTSNEIDIMKEKEKKLKDEITALQKQVDILSKGGKIDPKQLEAIKAGKPLDSGKSAFKGKLDSTGLVPAGIAPGKALKDPPPVPKDGMPGSLQNAPIPVASKKKAVNKEGGLAALFADKAKGMKVKPKSNKLKQKEALEKLGLPDKAPVIPGVKMTQIFWKVVSPEALEGTIWPELSDQTISYDKEELEGMFGKSDPTLKKKTSKKVVDVDEKAKFIDSQRRQNLAIALSKVKMSHSDIKKAIIEANTDILSREVIQVFIDTIPTVDELTLIEKFVKDGSDPTNLAREESYLYEMSQIPSLETRLKCIKTAYTFSGDAKRIYSQISRVKKALKEVNTSSELRRVLEIILAIGNHMNGGTTRGAAWGFKLDVLSKLANVKDSNNNGSLMHYLYALFERNYPDLCDFSLPQSAAAVDVNFKETAREMNALAKQISTLKQEVKKKPFSKADKFRKKFSSFEVKASKDVENLQAQLEKVRSDFHNLALKFAETGNEVEPLTFFPTLVAFEQDLRRAGTQLKVMRQEEARQRLLAEKKEERNVVRKLKLLVENIKDEDGNVDMGLIQAYKQSQKGKANEVVDRFLEKYRRDQESKGSSGKPSRNRRKKKGK